MLHLPFRREVHGGPERYARRAHRSDEGGPVPEPVITIDLNPRERRLYDRMRAALSGMDLAPGSGFRDVVLLLPDLTVLLARLLGVV